VVYATTEPTEALLLGGHTAVLDAGELLQYGPTAEVFHRPRSIRVARAFSDPPLNLVVGTASAGGLSLPGGVHLPLTLAREHSGSLTLGVRAGALRIRARPGDIAIPGAIQLAEISGSDTFAHVQTPIGDLVAQLTGVHLFSLGEAVTLYLNPAQTYVFDRAGLLLVAPTVAGS
jgi:glycerol transport system ATP-binding protein